MYRDAAIHLHRLGFNVMPTKPGLKEPLLPKWKVRQERRLTRVELQRTFMRRDCGIAIICGELAETGVNVLGIDFDHPAEFERALREWPAPGMATRTPKGFHGYWQVPLGVRLKNSVDVLGREIDVRHHGAYLLAPPSWSADTKFRYEWLPPGPCPAKELPFFPAEVLQAPRVEKPAVEMLPAVASPVRKAAGTILHPEAYCMRVESEQGKNGSKGLVRVVCIMREAGRSPAQAYDFIRNTWSPQRAKPPWSDREIVHAIRRHYGLRG